MVRCAGRADRVLSAEERALQLRVRREDLRPDAQPRRSIEDVAELRAAVREEHPRLVRMESEDPGHDRRALGGEERRQRGLVGLRRPAELEMDIASVGRRAKDGRPRPHVRLGEDIAAAVVLKPGAISTARELQAFLSTKLPYQMVPRRIFFMTALPRGSTGKVNVFKDVPSDNSYYPSWTADGKQILFTTRPHEVWDLVTINSDGANFHVLKPGVQNEVTRYSPIWARDGQSVFCQDMANVYQLGLDGAVRVQWKIDKIVPKGDMSGDGRIDVSPNGKRLLLSIDMGEESGRKDWDGPLPALWAFDLQSQKATRLTPKKLFGWDGIWIDNDNILFLSRAAGEKDDSIYRMSADGKNLKRLIKNGRFPSVSGP